MWVGIQKPAPFSVQFIGVYIISDIALNPLDARSIIEIRANGDVFANRLQGSDFVLGTWVTGTGFDANDFDFQWQQLGNNPNWGPGDPSPNIWVNGGGTISWGAEETGLGTFIASGTLLVRPAGGGATIDSSGVSLNAESTL
jgi:hypothetical protein